MNTPSTYGIATLHRHVVLGGCIIAALWVAFISAALMNNLTASSRPEWLTWFYLGNVAVTALIALFMRKD